MKSVFLVMMVQNSLTTGLVRLSGKAKGATLAVLLGVAVTGVSAPAMAQSDTQQMQHQIQLLRREIADLQRMVFKGEAPASPASSSAASSGVSGGDLPPDVAGRLQVKMQRLEERLRDMNGSYEEMDNRIRRMETRLDKLVTDIDFRLRALEEGAPATASGNPQSQAGQQQAGLNTVQPTNAPSGDTETTIITSQGAQGPAAPRAPQTLGTLTQEDLQAAQSGASATTAPQTASAPPAVADTAEAQYQQAMNLLHQYDFNGAETALRGFLDRYPDDKLAGNAQYWLGETYYARKQYAEAARVFSDAYTQDKQGSKATHSLLKLAMSLDQVGQGDASCVAYLELISKHPDAEPRILDRAKAARKSLGCQ